MSCALVCSHNWDHAEVESNYCKIKSIIVIVVEA